jgi:hypothetical protein
MLGNAWKLKITNRDTMNTKERLDDDQMTSTPPPDCPFVVGDVVSFTNDYGIVFENRKVVGFTLPGNELLGGNNVYLEKDAYWFPVHVKSLSKTSN